MKERKAVTRETRGEYLKAGKKEKGLILDQYLRLTGYNRKYAIRALLTPPAKTTTAVIDGNPLVFKAEKKPKPKNPPVDMAFGYAVPRGEKLSQPAFL
jgi:hypothetical protein